MVAIDLKGMPVFITGALGGIGEYLVRTLDRAGATLLLTDVRGANEARDLLAAWNVRPCWYRTLDVTDAFAMGRCIEDAFKDHPRLATVIGHAGGCELHPFASTSAEKFADIFTFNFLAQTYLARVVLAHWTEHSIPGHLLFTSSYVARAPHVKIPAYASAKAALETFGKCLALEYGEKQIRVNLLAPGNVAVGSALKVYESNSEYRDFCDRVSPLGRRNTPQAIADAMLFLVSPLAGELNGQVLQVDTGISIPKIG